MELNNEAWEKYRHYQYEFNRAGIPWNQKGSPHKLRIQALHWLRKTPFHIIVRETIRLRTPQLIKNITANNALLKRLKANASSN